MFEKTIKKKDAYHGKLLRIEEQEVELSDGSISYREIVRHPGAIGVVSRLKNGDFVFVQQYRKPVEKVMTEIVAGLLDPGEERVAAAHRELAEETGYKAESLISLGIIFATPGYCDEEIEIFFAELNSDQREQQLDHGEQLEVVKMSRDAFSQLIRDGKIQDSKTLSAWAMWLEYDAASGNTRDSR